MMSDSHENLLDGALGKQERITRALAHLDHLLPAQAPIQDFVHHNTLHGFQHLPFEEALVEAERITGISAYHDEEVNREFYKTGRINDEDLQYALSKSPHLRSGEILCRIGERELARSDLQKSALLYDFRELGISELNWQIDELGVLDKPQADLPEEAKRFWAETPLGSRAGQDNAVRRLWISLCRRLNADTNALHPENLLDLNVEQTEQWLEDNALTLPAHEQTQIKARQAQEEAFGKIGRVTTLRDFVFSLSGKDVLELIRPQLIRMCASVLDEGVASWPMPDRSSLGLFGAWRKSAALDVYPFLHDLPDWHQIMSDLPESSLETIILQLEHFDIPTENWEGYLSRLALELPGWAGMMNWRQQRPKYKAAPEYMPDLADLLAIRLTLDRLWLNQICRDIWKCEARLSALQGYFGKNLSEFFVRQQLYGGELPEYLCREAHALVIRAGSERQCRNDWQHLADLIFTWQQSPLAENASNGSTMSTVWRLFRLCQHLHIRAEQVDELSHDDLLLLLNALDDFDSKHRRHIWLLAYERHYREELFNALTANHGRGRWVRRESLPSAQIVFCMDDREESFRRHVEELDPNIETLGAAGFFGLAMNYQGLDDERVTPLCPIVVTPAHEVREQPVSAQESRLQRHRRGREWLGRILGLMNNGMRRYAILSQLSVMLSAPAVLVVLAAKSFFPKAAQFCVERMARFISPDVPTRIDFVAEAGRPMASPDQPQFGFTDEEQCDRIAAFLRNAGLTYGFSPLIVLMGHGSISQNNPHLAAYDCGACSGRHGGPNARLFAAMANRKEVRRGLSERGIHVPDSAWFLGAEHNTCNEDITWFDVDAIPADIRSHFDRLQTLLAQGQQLSAHERCRRLASAPRNPALKEALHHIAERADDYSQTRPELGHATNAAALIGRRSASQGVFFDRRLFLISYDATQDPEGKIVEGILLNVGPVGAGINLEYYFSTVNNQRFGCGTKVPHNIVGLFGVMEGAQSDLRTGLPRQMIEIHEAMRLQLVVEAKTEILEKICARQPSLLELVDGGWVLLSALDPETGALSVYESGRGFAPWQSKATPPKVFATSSDCYRDQTDPIAPALIQQPGSTQGQAESATPMMSA